MSNLWLKIKVWTKLILTLLVIIYVLVFIFENNESVPFWWWYNREGSYSKLLLIGIAFVAGIIATVLFRTTIRTIRQIRDLRSRNRSERLERDLAEMKEKASRLQTKPAAAPVDVGPPSDDAAH